MEKGTEIISGHLGHIKNCHVHTFLLSKRFILSFSSTEDAVHLSVLDFYSSGGSLIVCMDQKLQLIRVEKGISRKADSVVSIVDGIWLLKGQGMKCL